MPRLMAVEKDGEPLIRGLVTDDNHAYIYQPKQDRMAYVDYGEWVQWIADKGADIVTADLEEMD